MNRQAHQAMLLEEWLVSRESLDSSDALCIANQLSDRSEPKVKRSALNNILRVRLDKARARQCARSLIDAGVLKPGEQAHGQCGGNTLHIDYDLLEARQVSCGERPVVEREAPPDHSSDSSAFMSEAMRSRVAAIMATPVKYARYRQQLKMLDGWLRGKDRKGCVRATTGQRAYEQVGYRLPYVLYCGDIDRSGACIVLQARAANDIEIRLARGMYKAMVRKQKERMRQGWEMEAAARQAFPERLDEIAKEIPLFARWQFLCAIRENKRIPQEILALGDYLSCMR